MRTIIILFVLALGVNAVEINGKLIHAVALAESRNNHRAVGDQGKANGAFQMWKIAWTDCNRWRSKQGYKAYSYKKYVNDPYISHIYCKTYLSILHSQLNDALDRDVTIADLYAAYNMGFEGYRVKAKLDPSKTPAHTQAKIKEIMDYMSK